MGFVCVNLFVCMCVGGVEGKMALIKLEPIVSGKMHHQNKRTNCHLSRSIILTSLFSVMSMPFQPMWAYWRMVEYLPESTVKVTTTTGSPSGDVPIWQWLLKRQPMQHRPDSTCTAFKWNFLDMLSSGPQS